MWKCGYAIAVVGAVLTAHGTSARPPVPFDIWACGTSATDIVVTDPDGKVLESWRGELKPGDVVRLGPSQFTPANALPWDCLRLRPDRALSGLYHPPRGHPRSFFDSSSVEIPPPSVVWWPVVPDVADTEFRLVLFLRKEGTTGIGAVWMPATAPPTPQRPDPRVMFGPLHQTAQVCFDFDPVPDFRGSVALLEAGRVLAFRSDPREWTIRATFPTVLAPIALNVKQFHSEVATFSTPPLYSETSTSDRKLAPFSNATLDTLSNWSRLEIKR